MGAAIAAGIQVGFWPSLEAIEQKIKVDKIFSPEISDENRNKKRGSFKKAVQRSFDSADL
jgi:glycerol kinase